MLPEILCVLKLNNSALVNKIIILPMIDVGRLHGVEDIF